MNTERRQPIAPPLSVLLLALLLAGCGGGTPATAPTSAPVLGQNLTTSRAYPAPAAAPTSAPAAGGVLAMAPTATPAFEGAGMPAPASAAVPAALPAEQLTAAPAAEVPGGPPITQNDPTRKIIKDATMTLEVANVDLALSRISGAAAQVGGYVLETRTDYVGPGQRQAILKIAVPVDQFEAMLQRIRESGSRVIGEQVSGIDATQEYVDTQSQLANLEATQARIRQFLEQAKNVEEALQVNARLTEIEGQIGQLKGRLQFLSQRAAYSTIAVQLQQPPPPTPTPSPTPTPEPLWNPSKTAAQASTMLTTIVQALVTLAIWLAIVVLPLAVPVVLVALLVGWLRRDRVAD